MELESCSPAATSPSRLTSRPYPGPWPDAYVLTDSNAGANLKHWLFSSEGGNLYIGTTTDASATSSPAALTLTNTGNIGVGTSTPWRTLSVTGTAGFSSSLSAESGSDEVLCIDPTTFEMTRGGASCAASSLRYKENIQELTYGLDDVLAMRPVSYQWTLAERLNDRSRQVGFIAEEMVAVVPEVVEMSASGTPEGIDYDKLTSVLARAIQQIAAVTGTFKANLIAWFADATNGIMKIVTHLLAADRVETQELCVTDGANDQSPVCVTKTELAALLSQSPAASLPISVISPPSTIRDPDPPIFVSSTTPANDNTPATSSPQAALLIEEPVTSSEPEALPIEPGNDNPAPPETATGT